MNVVAIKSRAVHANELSLIDLINESIHSLKDGDVLAITSKVVSLCENNVVAIDGKVSRDDLIIQEADRYLPASMSLYKHHFTVKSHTLIAGAGIDESNGDNTYILWPKDSQATANTMREYLKQKYNLKDFGVVITDSTCQPLRLGTMGITLAHSGFSAVNDYIGKPDIFGRPFGVTQANVASGLSATAVLTMGEGSEQTPFAILSDLPFVSFQDRNPTKEELELLNFNVEEDLFAPFLNAVDWQIGNGSK